MRTFPTLSTLFAVSLLGGVALAENPHVGGVAPRVVEKVRAHGDIVDKTYGAVGRGGGGASMGTPAQAGVQKAATPLQRVSSRINCSDSGVDCGAPKGNAGSGGRGGGEAASHAGTGAKVPPIAILNKVLGSDRTNFNEAGEDQGMSLRAAKRAWERANGFHRGGRASAELPLSAQQKVDRHSEQRSDARMSCNEADECSMSVKAARKEWANASIRAGTWTGPAKEPVSNAARRITEQRAAEGAGAAKPADATEGRAAHPEAAEHADHPH
jgi:hypothetical protein